MEACKIVYSKHHIVINSYKYPLGSTDVQIPIRRLVLQLQIVCLGILEKLVNFYTELCTVHITSFICSKGQIKVCTIHCIEYILIKVKQ